MKFLMIYPNSTGNTKVALGIIYIMKILKDRGHEVCLFDMTAYGVELEKHDINIRGKYLNFRPIDMTSYGIVHQCNTIKQVEQDLAEKIKSFNPDLAGVSITEDTSMVGLRLAGVSKRIRPNAPVVFGGVFCMTMPEFVISQEAVDIVCVGEGEQAIIDLTDRLTEKKDIRLTPGFWVKEADGTIHRNQVAPPTDLDTLPFPDLSQIDDMHLYSPMAGHVYKMTFVESQRGCPRRCTYCCNQLFLDAYADYRKQYLRRKSVPRLIDELIYLKETFRINFFQFSDDDFLLRPEGELRLFKDLYKEKIDLPFWIQAEARNATENKISLVKESGCMAISMGIETGSDRIRTEVYKRNTPKELTVKAFDIMHKYGIRTSGNIIIGVPYEGRKEIFETIDLVRKCRPRSLNVNIFAPYYGTVLREYCVEMGYLEGDFLREGRISWKAVLNMPQITDEEIEGLARTFVLYSTLPSEYFPEIKKCELFTEESKRIFAELEKVYWEIADERGIDYHVPGFDYEGFLAQRQQELDRRAK